MIGPTREEANGLLERRAQGAGEVPQTALGKRACRARSGHRDCWLGLAGMVFISLVVLVRSHFQFTVVVGTSMLPTLKSGDFLLVDRQAYRDAEPQRGDIVLARDGKGCIVKRIVGLPSEEVEVREGILYINGTPRKEDYPVLQGRLDVGKGKLLERDFATLGDNRAVPPLTAVHPLVTKADIVGKVIFCFGRKLQ